MLVSLLNLVNEILVGVSNPFGIHELLTHFHVFVLIKGVEVRPP
jgi:hypothetical protein